MFFVPVHLCAPSILADCLLGRSAYAFCTPLILLEQGPFGTQIVSDVIFISASLTLLQFSLLNGVGISYFLVQI